MNAASLANKVAKVIKKVGPMARATYLRTITYTGGDEFIGRLGTKSYLDFKFDPQPIFHQLGHRQAMYLSTSTLQLVSDDYKFTFPVEQVNETYFQQPNVSLVLSDENGVESLRILYINNAQYGGADVALEVFARSTGHGEAIIDGGPFVAPVIVLVADGGSF